MILSCCQDTTGSDKKQEPGHIHPHTLCFPLYRHQDPAEATLADGVADYHLTPPDTPEGAEEGG